jgi:hypothetical protein
MKNLLAVGFAVAFALAGARGAVAEEVGPEEVVTVEIPVRVVGDEEPLPVIARGEIKLPEACEWCYLHTAQYKVILPEGVVGFVLELSNLTDPAGDLDLMVRVAGPVTEDADTYYFTYRSDAEGGEDRLELPDEADSALAPGEYYIGIVSLVEAGAEFELRAAAYVEEALPAEIALTPNVPFTGTVPAQGLLADLEEQLSIVVPEGAELLALKVIAEEGSVDLYVGRHPVAASPQGRVRAQYHLRSSGSEQVFLLESPEAGRYWISVGNRAETDRAFTLIATPLPEVLSLTSGSPVAGAVGAGAGLLPLLTGYLRTAGGEIGLVQYRIDVPQEAVGLEIALRGLEGESTSLHVRRGSPVRVRDEKVIADLSSTAPGEKRILLQGAFLAPGATYYIAVEGTGEGAVRFELVLEFFSNE